MSETTTAPVASAAPAQLPCPRCQQPVPYFDQLNSAFFVCPSCHTYFKADDSNEKPQILGKFQGDSTLPMVLPPGTAGTLRGQPYRVLSYQLRREKRAAYQWQEYMLRHEQTGQYCQLAVYEGHWLLLEPAGREYNVAGMATRRGAVVNDEEADYHIYNSYQPRVLYGAGEFDWDFRDDQKLTITEYIAPPHMLVRERDPGKGPAKWYKGEHLEPDEVATAFGMSRGSLPYRSGVGAAQPAPGQTTWPVLRTFSLLMLLVVVVTQLALLFIKPEKQLLREEFSTGRTLPANGPLSAATTEAQAAGSNAVLVSKPFEVTGPAALQFELESTTLYNQWLEVPVTLVNERTGQSYEFTKSLEFYTGVEGGESWQEGSKDQDATLANIPSGRYHLTLYPVTENGMDLPLRLTASQHTPLQSNGILALLLLALYPAVQYWRRYSHDATRWLNSDYGPTDNS